MYKLGVLAVMKIAESNPVWINKAPETKESNPNWHLENLPLEAAILLKRALLVALVMGEASKRCLRGKYEKSQSG